MNLLAAQAAVRPKLVWAPKIVEAIAAGSQPLVLTAEALAERTDLPLLGPRKSRLWASGSLRRFDHPRTWPPGPSSNRPLRRMERITRRQRIWG
jgi:hypothetical protein